jgi:hypothetical protein
MPKQVLTSEAAGKKVPRSLRFHTPQFFQQQQLGRRWTVPENGGVVCTSVCTRHIFEPRTP